MSGIRKWQKDKKAGFTLIELVVVMVIIGVLAAVAVVSYHKSVDAARDSVIRDAAEKVKVGIQCYYAANGALPTSTGFYAAIIGTGNYVTLGDIEEHDVSFALANSGQSVLIKAGSSTHGRQATYTYTRSDSDTFAFDLSGAASTGFADYTT